jgi:hypothetical protein
MDSGMNKITVDRRTSHGQKYLKSPFRAGTVAEVDLGYKTLTFGTGDTAIDQKTGEVLGEAAYKQTRVVDKSKFLMVYQSMQNFMWQLSQRAQKVLRVIYHEVSERAIGKDEIYLNWEVAEEIFAIYEIKISRATYFRGLGELIDKMVIAEATRQNIYYINPTLIFNGNRATFIQQIISEDPSLVNESYEMTAKRSLEASVKLSESKLKGIGDSIKNKNLK